jgi:uncharacterized phage infection (PIP) family protein YhgE
MDNGCRQLKERDAVMDFQPMSPEEMQRTMQFLLNQQARFDTLMEQLTGKVNLMADGLAGLTGIMGRLATNLEHSAAEHDRQLRESREQLEAADADLRSYIRDVESHLDVVIEMFERHLREDHGSKPS